MRRIYLFVFTILVIIPEKRRKTHSRKDAFFTKIILVLSYLLVFTQHNNYITHGYGGESIFNVLIHIESKLEVA